LVNPKLSLFLKQLASVEITNSGKEFHVLTSIVVNEFFAFAGARADDKK